MHALNIGNIVHLDRCGNIVKKEGCTYSVHILNPKGSSKCAIYTRQQVREAAVHLCKDSLSVQYLADTLCNTVFIMYLHMPARNRVTQTMIGCAIVEPMSSAVLCLKCLCANKDVRSARAAGRLNPGSALLSTVERFAVDQGYRIIRLRALASVVGFYRKNGFTVPPVGKSSENPQMTRLIDRALEIRYFNDQEFVDAFKIGRACAFNHGFAKAKADREWLDARIMSYINDYFRDEGRVFVIRDDVPGEACEDDSFLPIDLDGAIATFKCFDTMRRMGIGGAEKGSRWRGSLVSEGGTLSVRCVDNGYRMLKVLGTGGRKP